MPGLSQSTALSQPRLSPSPLPGMGLMRQKEMRQMGKARGASLQGASPNKEQTVTTWPVLLAWSSSSRLETTRQMTLLRMKNQGQQSKELERTRIPHGTLQSWTPVLTLLV